MARTSPAMTKTRACRWRDFDRGLDQYLRNFTTLSLDTNKVNHRLRSSSKCGSCIHGPKHAVAALGALVQETRLALFRLLVTCGPEGLPAGVIAERPRVAPSSLSFHLQQLVHAGLITQRRLSRQLIYAAEYGTMNELMAYLTENCCAGAALCLPTCNPASTFTTGESDEAPPRARAC
jgi:ArsR family transcriptional regulator